MTTLADLFGLKGRRTIDTGASFGFGAELVEGGYSAW